ncbi:MAG: hypothetical protein KA369_04585 [Spirochaetes bacterium]|nr:hypothetical protein [Spirochaetota bacterium]
MNKFISIVISIMLVLVIGSGCSKKQLASFQQNDQEPQYNLLKLFDGFPALHSAIDSLDSQRLNDTLGDMLLNGFEIPLFLRDAVDLVQAPFLVPMVGELHGLLKIMMDPADYHYKDSGQADKGYYDNTSVDRLAQFYSALDQVADNTNLSSDILAMAGQVVDYMVNEKDPVEIESDMGRMMKVRFFQHCMYDASGYAVDLPAGDYTLPSNGISSGDISSLEIPIGMKVTLYDGSGNSVELTSNDRCLTDNLVGATVNNWNDRATRVRIEYDVTKLAKLLGKMTMSCDYPMWVNGSYTPPASRDLVLTGDYTRNTDLGNATKGLVKLLYGLNNVIANDSEARDIIDSILAEDVAALLNAPDGTAKMKSAIINLSEYFGTHEFGDNAYDTVADYHNTNPYVNASLKETVRDMVPNVAKLFIRDDDSSTLDDTMKIFSNSSGRSPVEELTVSLAKLKNAGIDYNTVTLEPSIKRMLEYNGRGRLRSADGSWSSLSYLDHLVFTIAGSYNFGFLTQLSSDGEEPASNWNRTHGASTNGIITINDSMYALTSGQVTVAGCSLGMHSYSLALDERLDQGDHVARSSFPYSVNSYGSHKFYLGYDFPTLGLLPAGCAGDAGIPNGGETAVSVTSKQTLSTTGSENDYRTYFPKVADGKGILNTAQFLMSWLARSCWDGGGPYYYSPEKDNKDADTMTFNWPGKGNRTVCRYYKPNGEVYAYVYKPSSTVSTWEYWYPHKGHTAENANDVSDNPDNDSDVNSQRANRYRPVLESDYFVITYDDGGRKYLAPPMNAGGDSWVDGTSGNDMFHLNQSSNGSRTSGNFRFFEKIPEQSAIRECRSQEEAMYRNLQWFLLEKKFVFTIPMYMKAALAGITLGHSGAFVIIEANGAVGLANARKGDENGHWASDHYYSSKIHLGDVATANVPDYRDSSRPGDGRILVFVRYLNLALITISNDYLFGTILGNGYVLPDAVGRNIDPVVRMGFLNADVDGTDQNEGYIQSSNADIGVDGTTLWDNRNKFFPLLLAITGTLWEGTSYTKTTSGHNYNYTVSQHKYPLADLLEGIFIPLSKPLMRYYTADNRWVPRVKTESGFDYQYFNPNTAHDTTPYLPREVATNGTTPLRTVLSVMTGSGMTDTNGLLPMVTDNTRLVTRLMALLQKLGETPNSAQRQNVALGLEQLMTAMKINKSEAITNGYHKTLNYTNYQWVFSQRNEDISLEDFLGYEGPFRTGAGNEAHDAQWTTFTDSMSKLKQFVGGSRDITPNLVNIVNAVLAQSLTEEQVHGLLYTAGKIFAKHDSAGWHYHGYDHGTGNTDAYDQLIDMVAYLPQVHDVMKTSGGTGEKYERMLKNVDILLKNNDSILNYAVTTMTTPYSMQYIIEDLDRFLGWSIVSDPNSPLWDDLVLMLEAMADMNDPRVDINVIIKNLGFQAD